MHCRTLKIALFSTGQLVHHLFNGGSLNAKNDIEASFDCMNGIALMETQSSTLMMPNVCV